MSCNVTAIAAARKFARKSRARPIAINVLNPSNGVNPKNIPIAIPKAIACSESFNLMSSSHFSRNHPIRFIAAKFNVRWHGMKSDCPLAGYSSNK